MQKCQCKFVNIYLSISFNIYFSNKTYMYVMGTQKNHLNDAKTER